jgi:hypothetical protein
MKEIIEELERMIAESILQKVPDVLVIQSIIKDIKAYDDKVQALIKTCENVIEFEKRNK